MNGERYPSLYRALSVDGTLICHHFQSEASFEKMLPEKVVISVESWRVILSQYPSFSELQSKAKDY